MRGESARPGKRPLRALSATEKMEAIQRVHDGESKASVARDIGVPESTLRGWCKSEHKIRGMARNSSTPDSEAHSPAQGTAAGTSNSEDEAAGPSPPKRLRAAEEADSQANSGYKAANDYVNLLSSLVAGGNVRPEQSALILQQLGIFQSSSSLTKNLLGLGGSPHTVGLVENGLQYSKGANGSALGLNGTPSHQKRSSASAASSPHISAIAPTSHMESVSKSGARKSLPPAAEAPSTPVPASPRRTSGEQLTTAHNGGGKKADSDRSHDKELYMWLAQQQQQFLGQTVAPLNPSPSLMDASWFWQFYKNCGFPMGASPVLPAQQPPQLDSSDAERKRNRYRVASVKKSPSKSKAIIDNVLCMNNNNNNNSEHESANRSSQLAALRVPEDEQPEDLSEAAPDKAVACSLTREEALEHAKMFRLWLEKCSEPCVTQVQIMQFKFMLDSLDKKQDGSSYVKHSRK